MLRTGYFLHTMQRNQDIFLHTMLRNQDISCILCREIRIFLAYYAEKFLAYYAEESGYFLHTIPKNQCTSPHILYCYLKVHLQNWVMPVGQVFILINAYF